MLKRILGLLCVSVLLCACTKNNYEEITFSTWGSVTEVEILNKIISDFETQNPDIKINFMHIPQNYFQKLHLLFASSQAPDVIFINNIYLPLYADKLEDLSELINTEEYYPESIKAMSFGSKLAAVPRDISNLVFYRNKDLISKTPKDLSELVDVISMSREFGISYERDAYFIMPFVMTFGEEITSPSKSSEFYTNLEGKYAPTLAESGSLTQAQMFLDGRIGLFLSGRWMYPKIKESAKFNWDVITFPGIVPLDTSGWAISKESEHKESAQKFVKFLASKSSSEYFLNTGLVVPARIDVSQDIDNKVFLEAIGKSKAFRTDKDYKKNVDKLNKILFN